MKFEKLNYAVLCEEIRREDNGKLLFIGVFGASILAANFPAKLRFTLGVSAVVDQPGEVSFEVQINLNGKPVRTGKGIVGSDESGTILFPVGPVVVDVSEPGTLDFNLTFDNTVFERAISVPVMPMARETSSVSPPPS